ncbi:MAG: hypothetical protein CMJ90_03190 [Planctomycetes bacterium]|nr:hypothetical protein [Planctomycetota bacterium]
MDSVLYLLNAWIPVGIAVGLIVLGIFWFIAIYNGLVRLRNQKDNSWSQIDVQLKRRHDLIPNLLETVKGYAKHESETFEKVTAARNMAMAARGPGEAGKAEGMLGMALSGLFAVAESYPDLKANQNFGQLQEELASTENKISFARQAYNDSATRYNIRRETFPANLVSGGFAKAELFEITEPGERAVPKVSF